VNLTPSLTHVRSSGYIRLRRLLRRQHLTHGVVVGLIAAVIMAVVAGGQLFQQTSNRFTNALYAASPLSGEIVLIAIDDASLGSYGRSVATWSRTRHADLLTILANAGARVVGFDVLFAENTAGDAAMRRALQTARDARTRVVLAAVGRQGTSTSAPGSLIRFSDAVLPVFADSDGIGLGHVNAFADADNVVRRVPLGIQIPDDESGLLLSFSATLYLSYLRIPVAALDQVVIPGTESFTLTSQRTIPVDSAGQMMINYFGTARTYPVYSYRAVLENEVDPAVFADKVVIVGLMNAAGTSDRYAVPLGSELMSGIEIHANGVETLIQNRPLTEQPYPSQVLTAILLALVGGWGFAQFRWSVSIPLLLILYAMGFAIASYAFSQWLFVINIFYPAIALLVALFGGLIANILWETRQRNQIQRLLTSTFGLHEKQLVVGEIAPQITHRIAALVNADKGGELWTTNDDSGHLERVYGTSPTPRSFRKSIHTEAARLDSGDLLVPLRYQGNLLGVALVYAVSHRFTDEDMALVDIYAEEIAPVLANAKLYTRQLEQNSLLESVLTSTPEPVLVLNKDQQVIRLNNAAETLFSNEIRVQVSPIPWTELLASSGLPDEWIGKAAATLTNGEILWDELTLHARSYVLRGAPMPHGGWVLILNDVTPFKELDSFKTQMIRMVSHDLKNPIGVILGFTELMMDGESDESRLRMLRPVDLSARQMLALITDLLNLERMKTAKLALEPVSISDLVFDVTEHLMAQAQTKNQALHVENAPASVLVNVDRRQLIQALTNLVGNAIKYTPDGGTITVTAAQQGQRVHIRIMDTGYGISAAAQARLFEPFYRVRTRATANIPGTGLGLNLVKTVIEAHGGKISVQSEEGKGSTFTVDLPATVPVTVAETETQRT
jgi:signal transduction histidine kinase/CHASE2 domain-containing sensor protein